MKMKIAAFMVLVILALVSAAQADLVIKKKMSLNMMGMGSQESIMTEHLKTDRSYVERKGESPMAAMAGAGMSDIEITRLDKGVIWRLDSENKTYSETSLESLKEMMTQHDDMAKDMPDADEEDEYNWTVEVEGPSAQKFQKFDCQVFKAKATGIKKDDPEDKTVVTMEYWIGQNLPNFDEMQEYYHNYAVAVGTDNYSMGAQLTQAAEKYSNQLGDFFEKVKKAGGYPVKVDMTVQNAGGKDMSEMMEGEEETDKEEEMDEEEKEAQRKAKEMLSKMGISMDKKAGPKSADGLMTVMSMTLEVLDMKSQNVDPSQFEIPAAYSKQPGR